MQSQPHNNTCTHTLTFKPHMVIIIFFPDLLFFRDSKRPSLRHGVFFVIFFFIIHCRTLSFASTERVLILYRLPFRFSPISRAVECTEKRTLKPRHHFCHILLLFKKKMCHAKKKKKMSSW